MNNFRLKWSLFFGRHVSFRVGQGVKMCLSKLEGSRFSRTLFLEEILRSTSSVPRYKYRLHRLDSASALKVTNGSWLWVWNLTVVMGEKNLPPFKCIFTIKKTVTLQLESFFFWQFPIPHFPIDLWVVWNQGTGYKIHRHWSWCGHRRFPPLGQGAVVRHPSGLTPYTNPNVSHKWWACYMGFSPHGTFCVKNNTEHKTI